MNKLLTLLTFAPYFVFANTPLTLSVSLKEGPLNVFFASAITKVFKEIKLEHKLIHLPVSRSLIDLNKGIIDFEGPRVVLVQSKFKNIIKSKEPLGSMKFIAFTNDKSIQINKWTDLLNYRVAYPRGWKIFDNNVKTHKTISQHNSIESLFSFLNKKRTDVVLFTKLGGENFLKEKRIKGIFVSQKPLVEKDFFLVAHKKHIKLMKRIDDKIKKLKKKRAFKPLWKNALK